VEGPLSGPFHYETVILTSIPAPLWPGTLQ
jgi:hypothetical protein